MNTFNKTYYLLGGAVFCGLICFVTEYFMLPYKGAINICSINLVAYIFRKLSEKSKKNDAVHLDSV